MHVFTPAAVLWTAPPVCTSIILLEDAWGTCRFHATLKHMCTYAHLPSLFWKLTRRRACIPQPLNGLRRLGTPSGGCFKVSPGCKPCYAEAFAERFRGVPGHPYEQGFDVRLVPHKLADPLRWTRPSTIFVNSMSDLFQEGVPAAYIRTVVDIMLLAPWHTLQVLTKRAARLPCPARYKVLFVPRSLPILQPQIDQPLRLIYPYPV
jgi:hypothetical protein